MSIILVADYRAMLREIQSVELGAVLQSHLDAADLEASTFEESNIRKARAESLLRPYRRETGIAA